MAAQRRVTALLPLPPCPAVCCGAGGPPHIAAAQRGLPAPRPAADAGQGRLAGLPRPRGWCPLHILLQGLPLRSETPLPPRLPRLSASAGMLPTQMPPWLPLCRRRCSWLPTTPSQAGPRHARFPGPRCCRCCRAQARCWGGGGAGATAGAGCRCSLLLSVPCSLAPVHTYSVGNATCNPTCAVLSLPTRSALFRHLLRSREAWLERATAAALFSGRPHRRPQPDRP
jgi:hypothetical protein